jgi:hypothetical protein
MVWPATTAHTNPRVRARNGTAGTLMHGDPATDPCITSVMDQALETKLVHLKAESISIWSKLDSDGEVKLELQGEVALLPNYRYDRVSLEYTLRNTEGKVLMRDDTYVDLTFMLDGQVSFSHNVYLKPPVGKDAVSIELRLSAQVIVVDKPITMELPKAGA